MSPLIPLLLPLLILLLSRAAAKRDPSEKAETARRLNPHSRSQLKLDEASKRPAGMTPVPQKKTKPTKWQFGIRSRNQPLEAIGCIYRALQKLGAEWVVDDEWAPRRESGEDDRYVREIV